MSTATTMAAKKKPKKLWTTGEIAKLMGLTNPKAVATWIDDGMLDGMRFPGYKERRVHHLALREFLIKLNYVWHLRELNVEEGLDPETDVPPAGPEQVPEDEPGRKPKRKK